MRWRLLHKFEQWLVTTIRYQLFQKGTVLFLHFVDWVKVFGPNAEANMLTRCLDCSRICQINLANPLPVPHCTTKRAGPTNADGISRLPYYVADCPICH